MVTAIDPSLLLGFYQSRTGGFAAAGGGASLPFKRVAPTAPWNGATTPAESSAAVKAALAGRRFVNEGAAKLDLAGASADYRKLFALYQGLGSLMGVAEQAGGKGLSTSEKTRLSQAFARGAQELAAYVDDVALEKLRLIQGEASTSTNTRLGVPRNKTEYQTPPLVSGSSSNVVPAFQGAVPAAEPDVARMTTSPTAMISHAMWRQRIEEAVKGPARIGDGQCPFAGREADHFANVRQADPAAMVFVFQYADGRALVDKVLPVDRQPGVLARLVAQVGQQRQQRMRQRSRQQR